MPSDIGRGIKFGIGFALGVGLILTLFLFGLSMCAGHVHRRMMERMEEMMPRERRPVPETPDDPVALQLDEAADWGTGCTPPRLYGEDIHAVFLRG